MKIILSLKQCYILFNIVNEIIKNIFNIHLFYNIYKTSPKPADRS